MSIIVKKENGDIVLNFVPDQIGWYSPTLDSVIVIPSTNRRIQSIGYFDNKVSVLFIEPHSILPPLTYKIIDGFPYKDEELYIFKNHDNIEIVIQDDPLLQLVKKAIKERVPV